MLISSSMNSTMLGYQHSALWTSKINYLSEPKILCMFVEILCAASKTISINIDDCHASVVKCHFRVLWKFNMQSALLNMCTRAQINHPNDIKIWWLFCSSKYWNWTWWANKRDDVVCCIVSLSSSWALDGDVRESKEGIKRKTNPFTISLEKSAAR